MIRLVYIFCFISLICNDLQAQPTAGLIRYFNFDNCDGEDSGTTGVDAILLNGPQCGCGVRGNGLEFDGIDDAVLIPGSAAFMNTVDFSISFYYKSTSGASQDLLSRAEFCDNNRSFSLRAIPGSNTFVSKMRENNSKGTLWNTPLDQTNCWHHVVFVRNDDFHLLYLDGVLVEEQTTVERTDISNDNIELEISGGACLGIQDLSFRGIIDELRIYNRALNDFEVEALAIPIDRILTQDTLIFLGNNVDLFSSPTCADNFLWSPTQGVDNITEPNTTVTPASTTIYSLNFSQGSCTATDSVRVSVIDPDLLDCEQLFMANAFTPNADGNNDSYGISNPFALEEFVSLEILDKWGNRVFFSGDKFAKWDGKFKNEDVNPGVFLYRVLYRCGGVEQFRSGSVTLIR